MNYIEHLLTSISTVTGCVSISAFASLFGIPIRITSSTIGLKILITAGIKKCKSIIKKKKKRHDKILLLAKSKLNSVEVLISEALIDSSISHDDFILINNVQKEFNDMKEEIKNSNGKWRIKLYMKQCYLFVRNVEKNTESKNPNPVKTKNGRIMLLSQCAVCNSGKLRFIKE